MIIGDWIDSCQDIVEILVEQRRHVGVQALIEAWIRPWLRPGALTFSCRALFSKLLEDVKMPGIPGHAR